MRAYPGDIVSVYCPAKLVRHYGVVTEFNSVIDAAPRKGIAERTWLEFAEGEQVRVEPRNTDDLPREVVLFRAWSKVGDGTYNVLTKNCEQFVSWCRKGVATSRQLNNAAFALIVIILLLILSSSTKKSK